MIMFDPKIAVRTMSSQELENWLHLNYTGASLADEDFIAEMKFWVRQEIQRRDVEFNRKTD